MDKEVEISAKSYLEKTMADQDLSFNWKVNQHDEKRILEIYCHISIRLSDQTIHYIDDAGNINQEGWLHFSDKVCFFDPQRSYVETDHYLATFPMIINEGIEQGLMDNVIKHLKIVFKDVDDDLRNFVTDPKAMIYEVQWSKKNFEQTLKDARRLNRYSEKVYPFYADAGNKNLIQKIMEDLS